MSKNKIFTDLKQKKIRSVARKFKLRLIVVFGSAVKNRFHQKSDLDIAVYLENPDISFKEFSALIEELQNIFPEREVDVSILNHADPLFLKKILESCELVYGNPQELAKLKIYAFKRYLDHKRFFEMERKYVEKFIKSNLLR
jgi:predicted nucleotidyltransferase